MKDLKPSFLFYAPNVKVGGGKVLLFEILSFFSKKFKFYAVLSEDLEDEFNSWNLSNIEVLYWVKTGSAISWIKAELFVRKTANNYSSVFCFHNLPLLFSIKQRVDVYLQNRLILESHLWQLCNAKTYVVIYIQKLILALRCYSVTTYFVQTPSMKSLTEKFISSLNLKFLRSISQCPKVSVMLFYPLITQAQTNNTDRKFDFIYPADVNKHKNHHNLIAAWEILTQDGINCTLALTIQEIELKKIQSVGNFVISKRNIFAIGHINFNMINQIYANSNALIFPSRCESLGLPLLEAKELGLPILASNLGFVRDICETFESFDPESPKSIANSVKRYLKKSKILDKTH
jgi:glycosyltransferase involved in cell wall biosynthesis